MQNLVWFTNGLSCGGEKGRESETVGERVNEKELCEKLSVDGVL